MLGDFSTIGGEVRPFGLAALDPATGHATDFAPEIIGGGTVQFLDTHVSPGSPSTGSEEIQVVGSFTNIGGLGASGLAKLDRTGTNLNWNPPLTNISSVQSFAVSPNNIAYAYGRFSFNNDPLQQRLAALGGANASITLYDLSADEQALSEPGVISTLVVDGVTLYAAGQFDILQGLPRGGLAAISSDSGAVVPWNPTVGVTDLFPGSGVATIYAGADFVYIGGNFSNVNDRLRRNFAAFPRFKLSNTFIPGNPGSVQICMPADPGAQYRIESLDQPVAVDSGHDHFGGNADFLLHRTV